MATITFRAKVETIYSFSNGVTTVAYRRIKVPTLTRSHCEMSEFRSHPQYGGLANSDLFANVLATIKTKQLGEYLRLDRIPDNVSIDESGFLAIVKINV